MHNASRETENRFARRDYTDGYTTALAELFDEPSAPRDWIDEQDSYADALVRDPSLALRGNGVFLLLSLLDLTD